MIFIILFYYVNNYFDLDHMLIKFLNQFFVIIVNFFIKHLMNNDKSFDRSLNFFNFDFNILLDSIQFNFIINNKLFD